MRKIYRCRRCGGYYLDNYCENCEVKLKSSDVVKRINLSVGVFEDYDNIVLMTGLNVDKRLLNSFCGFIPSDVLILTSGVSDMHILSLLLHRRNYCERSTPFSDKNIYHFYGDGPYSFNDFVRYVYVKVPYADTAEKLREFVRSLRTNGVWGWELLSYLFREYIRLMGREDALISIEVRGKNTRSRDRLRFLVRMAGSPNFHLSESSGEIVVSDSKDDVIFRGEGEKVVEVPIMRFLPSFNFKLLRTLLDDLEGRTVFVTLGGAEHNVFLNLVIAERRELYDPFERLIYDNSNVFDLEVVEKLRFMGMNGLLVATHNYVGLEVHDVTGRRVVLARGMEKSLTGGVIVKMEHDFEEFYKKRTDLFVVFGAGPRAALATKLTFLRMLLEDSKNILRDYGIYYVILSDNRQKFDDIYSEIDPIHEASIVAPLLKEEQIHKASHIISIR